MKKLLLLNTLLTGCASPIHYLSDKDGWVAAGTVEQSIYFCERVLVKDVLLPVCVEASKVSDWVRLEKFKKPDGQK